ncbi:hypothetical protein [Psychromonas sp. SR45-3]|uniref:hypothetical protein n=1 Tax=Psychromonas sp. SR45-3 TaxID=2760930 RepID=UPI0015F819E1|nr:hypothetical protein [Psychromonas sp. SR45-3]MBB1271248.1 hypothetical protein [Psychromonas sp. SR45-3]
MLNYAVSSFSSAVFMSRESELLLSNLMSSFKGRHNTYKKVYGEFSTWFFLMLISLFITPILFLVVWWLGEDQLVQKLNNVLWVFIIYGIAILNLYIKVIKSKNRLNEIKQQLEDANFRVCANVNSANDTPLIITKEEVTDSQFTLKPFSKIDFKLYNFHFEV